MKMFKEISVHKSGPIFQVLFLRVEILLVLWVLCSQSSYPAIIINEIVAASSQSDEYGDPLEWVELLNQGSDSVNLSGYTLSDSANHPTKWFFPDISIPANGFLVVYTNGRNEAGLLHTNFRLKREGEFLGLFCPDQTVEDSIVFPKQRRDYSYGRNLQDINQWLYYKNPSPNQANNSSGLPGFAEEPVFSEHAGLFTTEVDLLLTAKHELDMIYFTLDGSQPDETDFIYTPPLSILRSSVVRARSFREGLHPSETVTHSYIIKDDYPLPVLSFVTDPDHLFDRRTGIYANPEQHGIEWERPVSVEYFSADGQRQFIENAGVRIHGGASRTRSPLKSFRLYFRSEYGASKLTYPLFSDSLVTEYNQLVIRGGFNDTWTYDREVQRETALYVSDQVVRNIHLDMGQPACRGSFAELYINGEYWGLYNPCERVEEDMLQSNINDVDWDVISDNEVKDGDSTEWDALNRWLARNSIQSSRQYTEINEMVDIENFTDYIIINIWMQNYDWPRHNWYAARERTDNGKWIFLLWDVEYSFGSGIQGYRLDQNTLDNATDTGHTIGLLFHKLIQNDEYNEYFWNRLLFHLDHALSEAHIMQRLDEQLDLVRPAIPAVAERWANDKNSNDWERAADLSRNFILNRTPILLDYVSRRIGSPPVSVSNWIQYGPQ